MTIYLCKEEIGACSGTTEFNSLQMDLKVIRPETELFVHIPCVVHFIKVIMPRIYYIPFHNF